MDPANDVTEFLSSRRARITPEQAELPTYGTRRVPGLADALALDDAEREHLFDLARAAGPVAPRRRRPNHRGVRPEVQRILDSLDTPAVARAAYGDYVAANRLGRVLYAPLFESPEQPANSARFTFLDPSATEFYLDWDRVAADLVAHLRSEAGPNAYDRALTDLVGELSTRSEVFRKLWAAHNVRFHRTGTKRIHHPIVGELQLSFESLALVADQGLAINVYTAEPGSRSEQTLRLLASWAATPAEQIVVGRRGHSPLVRPAAPALPRSCLG